MASMKGLMDKYIRLYSEPEISFGEWAVSLPPFDDPFDRILVVPICAEFDSFPVMIQSAQEAASNNILHVLIVLVVNHRKDAPVWMQENNKNFLLEWKSQLNDLYVNDNGAYAGTYKNLTLLVVDRASIGREFPQKQGVGLARKIGCDLAYFFWWAKKSKVSFAFTSDGDATLPQDYFVGFDWIAFEKNKTSAITFPFEHIELDSMSSSEIKAMNAYDYYLRYYQRGLRNSGSPYAYQNIGSTICFYLPYYGKVRGFPKKEAGEDFYFLNKLRKMGPIVEKIGDPIQLQGRPSTRVPFGTGKSIINISKTLANGEDYLVYHPHVFDVLKVLIEQATLYCHHRDYQKFLSECEEALTEKKLTFGSDYKNFAISHLIKVMTDIGLKEFMLNKINSEQSTKQNLYQFMVWFDSFKTLKFVHELRYRFFPSLPISSCLISEITQS